MGVLLCLCRLLKTINKHFECLSSSIYKDESKEKTCFASIHYNFLLFLPIFFDLSTEK